MTNLPPIDLDYLNEAAGRLEDNARKLVLEVRDLRKRAKALRKGAATLRDLDHDSTHEPLDMDEDEQ